MSTTKPKSEPQESTVKEAANEETTNTIGSLLQVAMAERESQSTLKSEPPQSSITQIDINVEMTDAAAQNNNNNNSEELAKSKKAKKISNISSILKVETASLASPTGVALNSPIKKAASTKNKRKSLDSSENESGAQKKKEKSSSTPSAAKKRKHISDMQETIANVANGSVGVNAPCSSLNLDIFGNKLNAGAVIPPSLKTSLENDLRATASDSIGATTATSSASATNSRLVGPPPPSMHSYSLLNEDSSQNE